MSVERNRIRATNAATIRFKGSYETIGNCYEKLFLALQERAVSPTLPSWELYLKAPGTLFRGNSESDRTEIRLPVAEDSAADGE